jgi:hypothetical protein
MTMTYADYCLAEAERLRSIDYGPARSDREQPYCTMRPDDRPLLDKSKSRLWLAQGGRWPCCGGWYPGVHRNGCRCHIADVLTPTEALQKWTPHDSHDEWADLNRV